VSVKGANPRHEIRLFHTERQPLSQQSALARAIPGRDTRPGGVGREAWTKLGLDRRAPLQPTRFRDAAIYPRGEDQLREFAKRSCSLRNSKFLSCESKFFTTSYRNRRTVDRPAPLLGVSTTAAEGPVDYRKSVAFRPKRHLVRRLQPEISSLTYVSRAFGVYSTVTDLARFLG
jgi:hypothetical protein